MATETTRVENYRRNRQESTKENIQPIRHFGQKKEENNSPNAEKSERLRGKNGRSTPKKEKASARGVGNSQASPATRRWPRPVRPTEAGARSGRNAYARRAQPDN